MQACVLMNQATATGLGDYTQNKNISPYYFPIARSEAPNGLLCMEMSAKSVDSGDKLQSCHIPSQCRGDLRECALRRDRSEVPCVNDSVTTTLLWLLQVARVEQWRNRKYTSSALTQERCV
jgi:hypothetical protein